MSENSFGVSQDKRTTRWKWEESFQFSGLTWKSFSHKVACVHDDKTAEEVAAPQKPTMERHDERLHSSPSHSYADESYQINYFSRLLGFSAARMGNKCWSFVEISFNAFCCLLKFQFFHFFFSSLQRRNEGDLNAWERNGEEKLRSLIYVLTRNDDGDKRKSLNV